MPTYAYQQTWDVDLGSPNGSTNATRVTSPVHDGAGALRLNAPADVAYWLKTAPTSTQVVVMRAYVRFATLPSVTTADLFGGYVGGTGFFGIGYNKTNNQFFCEIEPGAGGASGGPVLATNTWYLLDLKVDAHLNPVTVNARVDGTALAQASFAAGPFTIGDYRIGEFQASQTYDMYVDTFDVSHLAADYPLTSTTVPSAPQILLANGGNAQVSLNWTVPASDGGSAITGYKVYRSTTSNAETLLASPAGTGTIYTDFAVVNGTTYYYKVTAVNAVGESALSNELSGTPTAPSSPVVSRVYKRFYGPALLGNSASTLYTCPTVTTAVIRHIHVSNPTASTVDFTLSIGTNAAATRLWDGYPIPVDNVIDHYQDHVLQSGEFIQAVAGVAGLLNLTIDGYEITASAAATPIYPSDTLFPSNTSP